MTKLYHPWASLKPLLVMLALEAYIRHGTFRVWALYLVNAILAARLYGSSASRKERLKKIEGTSHSFDALAVTTLYQAG